MDSSTVITEKDWLACCGSAKFAQQMACAGSFSSYQQAVDAARDIWFNKVDAIGWIEAFEAHPGIGESMSKTTKSPTSDQWSKGEQSTALATATDATLQEIYEWNARYRQKFGFVFLTCASGRSTPEIVAEIKRRFHNRPIIEFDLAAKEQMKITELRMSKLFQDNATSGSITKSTMVTKAGEGCMSAIEGRYTTPKETHTPETFTRTRPPITTHMLYTSLGAPDTGIEVRLEVWSSNQTGPLFCQVDPGCWKL